MISVCVPSIHSFKRLTEDFLPSFKVHMANGAKLYLLGQVYSEIEQRYIRESAQGIITHIKFCSIYPQPASMFQIREDVAQMADDNMILWVDDDFEFRANSLSKYMQGYHWMRKHQQCGGIRWGGWLGSKPQEDFAKIKWHGDFGMNRGLMLRKINNSSYPKEVLPFTGGHKDTIASWWVMINGFYILDIKRCQTLHRHDPLFSAMGEYDQVEKGHTGIGHQGINAVPYEYSIRNLLHSLEGPIWLTKNIGKKWKNSITFHLGKAFINHNYALAKNAGDSQKPKKLEKP